MTESRLGLLFNGLLKVPMQFLILFVGVMVFVFYQFNQPPLFFNESRAGARRQDARRAPRAAGAGGRAPASRSPSKRAAVARLAAALDGGDAPADRRGPTRVRAAAAGREAMREKARTLIAARRCRAPRSTTPTTSSCLRDGRTCRAGSSACCWR